MNGKRRTLLLLMAVFLLPVLLAWWFLHYSEHVQTGSKLNRGTLISPPTALADQALEAWDLRDTPAPRRLLGRWSLLYRIPERCAQDCRDDLFHLRQIEALLGKDSLRVQRVLLPPGGMRQVPFPDLAVGGWRLTRPDELLDSIPEGLRGEGRVYLVDPAGSLMMYYLPSFRPEDLLKDLRRLLKASRIG